MGVPSAVIFFATLVGLTALSRPVSLDYWWTTQSMAFGVVLFGVLIKAPTLTFALRRQALNSRSAA